MTLQGPTLLIFPKILREQVEDHSSGGFGSFTEQIWAVRPCWSSTSCFRLCTLNIWALTLPKDPLWPWHLLSATQLAACGPHSGPGSDFALVLGLQSATDFSLHVLGSLSPPGNPVKGDFCPPPHLLPHHLPFHSWPWVSPFWGSNSLFLSIPSEPAAMPVFDTHFKTVSQALASVRTFQMGTLNPLDSKSRAHVLSADKMLSWAHHLVYLVLEPKSRSHCRGTCPSWVWVLPCSFWLSLEVPKPPTAWTHISYLVSESWQPLNSALS